MRTVRVELGTRSYEIVIGPGARREVGRAVDIKGREARQVALVSDETVFRLHGSALLDVLGASTPVVGIRPGENSKTLDTVERVCERLAELHIERSGALVAFGGGVVGDLTGFVAATWLRGIDFIQVPTTLLAAVDASVGGKTGVNLRAGKNLVGAFHQPRAVIVDTDFLRTLPPREFAAGLAECVKHGCIRDPDMLEMIESDAAAILARDGDALTELVARNCAIKADVVSRDEREADLRAILNFGHTVGHAIESLLGYELLHGECVGLGIRVENELAVARGWLSRADADRIAALLARAGLPGRLPRPLAAEDVWSACQVDKKVRGGAVNFVLLRAFGAPERVADVAPEELAAALRVVQPD